MNIDTAHLNDTDCHGPMAAEACTDVGWQDDEQRPMQMLTGVIVYAVVSVAALAAVFL